MMHHLTAHPREGGDPGASPGTPARFSAPEIVPVGADVQTWVPAFAGMHGN